MTTSSPTILESNLPVVPTRFFGREVEREHLSGILLDDDTRLVTILGPGGIGKTRLATNVAQHLKNHHRLDVMFINLSSARSADRMLAAIADALQIEDLGLNPEAQVLRELQDRAPLLILDNLEQIPDAGPVISRMLLGFSGLVILATSRIPLRIQGERQYILDSLLAADDTPNLSLEQLASLPAIALFSDRAQAVRPGFSLTGNDVVTVRDICLKIDGLPLAIELAAARIRIFSPEHLLAKLEDSLGILSRGSTDLPERHKTMQQAVAWSVDLLNEHERHVLLASSIFEGTFSYDAIEAVANLPASAIPDILSSLVEQSLVSALSQPADQMRFQLLQSVRDYARSRAITDGFYQQCERRHADFFTRFAAALADGLESDEQAKWSVRGATEYTNLQNALAWLIQCEDARGAVTMSGNMWPFWLHAGRLGEGRHLLEQCLALNGPVDPETRATAENGLGILCAMLGANADAMVSLKNAAAIRRELGDPAGVASVLNNLGNIASRQGLYAAATNYFEEALGILTELGNSYGQASVMLNIASVAHHTGNLDRAIDLTRQALAIRRTIQDVLGVAQALHNLGLYLDDLNDVDAAARCFGEAAAAFESLDNKPMLASTRNSLAANLRDREDMQSSDTQFQQALALARELMMQSKSPLPCRGSDTMH